MYKFNVYILTSFGFWLWRQKCYRFKNLVKFEGWQTNFKITLGTGVFKKSCSTSKLAGVGAVFDNFHWFFWSKSRACQLARLSSQTKPIQLKPSQAKWNQLSQASHIIAKQSKPSKKSKAKQAKQSKASKQSKAKQATKTKQIKQVSKENLASKPKQSKPSKLASKHTNKQAK